MRKKSAIILALVLIFTVTFTTTVASARTLSEVNKEIESEKQKLKEGQAEEAALSKEIEDLEQEIGSLQGKMDKIDGKIEDTKADIAVVEEELKAAEEKVNEQNANLNSRLRTMYKNGSVGFLDVILNSGSISEFISNIEMVKIIYSNDQEVLQLLQTAYDEIDAKKKELETLQEELVAQKQEQLDLKISLDADKAAVEKKKGIVNANNTEIQDNIAALNAEADKINSAIEADSNKNNGGGSGGETYNDGAFAHPCPGYKRVSSKYGWRDCPNHGWEHHSGIDLAANEGVPIYAAAGGVVITAEYNYSYGYYIIVSHGGGLYTLYAHCSRLLVGRNQTVSKGQQIAKVGTTGQSTGNHLHFEVRKGGNSRSNHVDPNGYVNF